MNKGVSHWVRRKFLCRLEKQLATKRGLGKYSAKLAIPNVEESIVYRDMFQHWLRRADPNA